MSVEIDETTMGMMQEDLPSHCFRVIVQTRWGTLVPQTVLAANLREALVIAYALPFQRWFDQEGDGESSGVESSADG